MIRIAKRIAQSGLYSRRAAEELIFNHEVKVNKELVTHPSTTVSESDIISINGKVINSLMHKQIYIYNKSPGELVTLSDPQSKLESNHR